MREAPFLPTLPLVANTEKHATEGSAEYYGTDRVPQTGSSIPSISAQIGNQGRIAIDLLNRQARFTEFR